MAQPKILLVDDEQNLLEVTKIYLEKELPDYTIITASSARSALKCMEAEVFDVIISDYQMAEMDGLEFLTKLREEGYEIPIIIFTGRGREEVVIRALNLGADYYLQKGGDPKSQFTELINLIEKSVEKRKAEDAVRKSEEKFSKVFHASIDNLMILRLRDCRILDVNDGFTKMLGYTKDDVLGKKPEELDLWANPAHMEDFPEKLQNNQETISFETILCSSNSKIIPVLFSAQVIEIEKELCILTISRDISELTVALERLKDSESRYKTLFQESPIALIEVDLSKLLAYLRQILAENTPLQDHITKKPKLLRELISKLHINEMNKLARDFFEPIDNDLTTSFLEFLAPVIKTRYLRFLELLDEDSTILEDELQIEKDGQIRHFYIRFAIAEGYEQNWQKAFISMVDITKRVQFEQEVRESEDLFRTFAEHTLVGILIIKDNRLVYTNQTAADIVGADITEALGADMEEFLRFVHPEDQPFVREQLVRKTKSLEGAVDTYDFRIIDNSGETKWLTLHSRQIMREGETSLGVVVINITARKRMEESLKRERKAYSTIATAAIHSKSIAQLCDMVLRNLIDLLGFSFGTIRLIDRTKGIFEPFAIAGLTAEEKTLIKPLKLTQNHTLTQAVLNRKMFFASDVLSNKELMNSALIKGLAVKSYISYPLINSGNEVIGSIQIASREEIPLPESKKVIFEIISSLFAAVLEQKLLEQAKIESEEQLRLFIEHSPYPIALFSGSKVEYLNPRFNEVTGYTVEDIPTLDIWFELAYPNPAYRRLVKTDFRILEELEPGVPFDPVVRKVVTKSGQSKNLISQPVKINPTKTYIIFEDITKRLELEKMTQERQQEFPAPASESIGGFIVVFDKKIVSISDIFAEELEYSVKTLSSWKFSKFIRKLVNDSSKVFEQLLEIKDLEVELDLPSFDVELRSKSGKTVSYSVIVEAIPYEENQVALQLFFINRNRILLLR